jgi:hypothetical protein
LEPARRVVTRAPHRSVGVVAVPWLQLHPIEHESFLERGFVDMAVASRAVVGIDFQPFKLDYALDDGPHTYVPDYLVTLSNRERLVVEVKPSRRVPEYRLRFDAIQAVLSSRDLRFFVVTEEHMPDAAVDQARLWRRYARAGVDTAQAQRALQAVAQNRAITFADLIHQGLAPDVVYHLLGRRELLSADRLLLTSGTRLLHPTHEEPIHERIYFERWFGCSSWGANVAP